MKKILVTGGAGFIGSNFVKYIIDKYPEYTIVNLDKLTYAGNPDNLKEIENSKNYRFVQGDIADEKLVNEIGMDAEIVINFAAETHVDRSIGNPSDFIMTDVYGTYVLLEMAKKCRIKRFIQISTDEVYGEAVDKPCLETGALMPKSPYAASKAGADRLVFSYWATYHLPAVITRCSNNYGPNQYPEKMIPLFVTNALEGKTLPVYGDGKNTRDWIYVEDHCRALDVIMHSKGIEGEVFNIGSGVEKSILEIADMILSIVRKPESLIQFVTDRPGHVMRHAVDTKKIKNRLKWEPSFSFDEAMRKTVEWYMNNEWWWKKIKSGEYKEYYRKMYQDRG
jgi:dTDP-glucose 4,6-dehydratase